MINFQAQLTRGDFALDAVFHADDHITALFGPSGSGKTTIIHLISGLLRPLPGRIAVGSRVLVDTEKGIFVPSHKRRAGLVFQDAQLFPHMTVAQNLHFGRWFTPPDRRSIPIDQVLDALGIAQLLNRRPAGLSGGEKQRVALARALLASPDLLLMDEPLAGLDQDRKLEILPLIERMRDEFRIPIIYVTHSADEVQRLASRVVMLSGGRVCGIGAPTEMLGRATDAPASQAPGASQSS
jgi:molybdate transport system ATP-binding protein